MNEKFSVPTLLVLGAALILGSVSIVTNKSPVKVSVSRPLSEAANSSITVNAPGGGSISIGSVPRILFQVNDPVINSFPQYGAYLKKDGVFLGPITTSGGYNSNTGAGYIDWWNTTYYTRTNNLTPLEGSSYTIWIGIFKERHSSLSAEDYYPPTAPNMSLYSAYDESDVFSMKFQPNLSITFPTLNQNIPLGSNLTIMWQWDGAGFGSWIPDVPRINRIFLKKDGKIIADIGFTNLHRSSDVKASTAYWPNLEYIIDSKIAPEGNTRIPQPGIGYSLWTCSPKDRNAIMVPGQESQCTAWAESGKFNITSVPFVFLNSPNGNNQLSRRNNLTIKWQGNKIVRVTFSLYKNDVFVKQLAGVSQSSFDQSYTVNTPFSNVPDYDLGKYFYKIRVSGYTADNKLIYDQSATAFAIVQ